MKEKIRILIHGGAGVIKMLEDNDKHLQGNLQKLKEIIEKNYKLLLGGATALDIAEQAVIELENFEGLNAAHGAVLNGNGDIELDAAIMDGRNRSAGAIAAVQHVKNPISGARAVMEYSQHILLVGNNADIFCKSHQVEMVPSQYFITEARKRQLEQAQRAGHVQNLDILGTVGAVVRDAYDNLAAATSTGGKTNKTPGRVGDTPIIGAGTWADNETCAISTTGDGEMFLKSVFAHEVAALIKYKNLTLSAACRKVLREVARLGGEGGCIAIDKKGDIVMAYNTLGMYRGWVGKEGTAYSAI